MLGVTIPMEKGEVVGVVDAQPAAAGFFFVVIHFVWLALWLSVEIRAASITSVQFCCILRYGTVTEESCSRVIAMESAANTGSPCGTVIVVIMLGLISPMDIGQVVWVVGALSMMVTYWTFCKGSDKTCWIDTHCDVSIISDFDITCSTDTMCRIYYIITGRSFCTLGACFRFILCWLNI